MQQTSEEFVPSSPAESASVEPSLREKMFDFFEPPHLDRRGWALLGALALAIWLATGLYKVQPDEQGIVLRFGQWIETTPPGLHFHLPWPIDTALFPKVTQIHQ